MRFIELLVGTILLRPYVFIFLGVFLLLTVPSWGWRRTLIFALQGYLLAWVAEYSSIHNGFPFGYYSYISQPTIERELWVAGVPFMDSLSFVFLTFAGLQTARAWLEPLLSGPRGAWDIRWREGVRSFRWPTWILAGILTMGMDVVIDPLALRGDHWFLGAIYAYPVEGLYFGVPWQNFAGWALLSWAILGLFALEEAAIFRRWLGGWRSYPGEVLCGTGLFIGVLAFNLAITFAIGETGLGLVGCCVSLLMAGPVAYRLLSQFHDRVELQEKWV